MSDEELLVAFAEGDSAAFESLYEAYAAQLHRYALRCVNDEDIARDVVQEQWIRFLTRSVDLAERVIDPDTEFALKPYLYRMVGHGVVNHYRATRRLSYGGGDEHFLDPVDDSAGGYLAHAQERFYQCLQRCLSDIPFRRQQAFWMTRDQAMSYAAAGDALGVAKETVKDWVRQILRQARPCREELEDA